MRSRSREVYEARCTECTWVVLRRRWLEASSVAFDHWLRTGHQPEYRAEDGRWCQPEYKARDDAAGSVDVIQRGNNQG